MRSQRMSGESQVTIQKEHCGRRREGCFWILPVSPAIRVACYWVSAPIPTPTRAQESRRHLFSSLVMRHIRILLLASRGGEQPVKKWPGRRMWREIPHPLFLTRWPTCLHLQAQAHPHSEIIYNPGQGISQEALAHTTLAGFLLSFLCLGLCTREPGLHLTLMTLRFGRCRRLHEVHVIEFSQQTWERVTILILCKGHCGLEKWGHFSALTALWRVMILLICLISTLQLHTLNSPC